MSDQQRAAMQMALNVLEELSEVDSGSDIKEAITALREALAQPQGEPVAWTNYNGAVNNRLKGAPVEAKAIREARAEQEKQEPVAWGLAEKVRQDLDRNSCPDAFMRIAMESIVNHYTTPPSVEAAIEATKERCAKMVEEWITHPHLAEAIRSMK